MNFKYYLNIFLLLFLMQLNYAQDSAPDAGTASVLLLRFNPAPRTSGLSGAFSGLADDENSIFFNPAGLANVTSGVAGINHTQWFEDIKIDNLLFAYKISNKFGIAASFEYMWMPSIEGRDADGNLTGSFDVSSYVAHIASSYKISEDFSMGIGIKYFQDKLSEFSTSGFGFDVGILWKTMLPGLSVGLAAQNLGGQVTYDIEKQDIPTLYRGGIAYKLQPIDLLFSLDVIKSVDRDLDIAFGGEYVIAKQFVLRLGNVFNKTTLFTPSFGAGFIIKDQYELNYTFANYSDIGSVHRAGFTFRFNKPYVYTKEQAAVSSRLQPPANLKARLEKGELMLSWDSVLGAQYNVYARFSNSNKWVKINKTPLYNNRMNFKRPKANGIFYFKVTSIYNGNESTYSKEVSIHVK